VEVQVEVEGQAGVGGWIQCYVFVVYFGQFRTKPSCSPSKPIIDQRVVADLNCLANQSAGSC
jgi:hypothetical protein